MGTRLTTPVRRRLVLTVVAVAAAFLVVRGVAVWRDTEASTTPRASTTLPSRTVEAGAVTVTIEPRQLDTNGALFTITFDTHSVDLDQDLANVARLTVAGTIWPVNAWTGDSPGGHHREGELRFAAAGPVTGTATLSIGGLPEPITASWDTRS